MTKFIKGILFFGLVLSMACQKKDDKMANGIYTDALKDPAIFSSRGTLQGKFVALLRLKTPALFEALKTDQLKKTIDADLLKQIEAEQKTFIDNLKVTSPSSVVLMKYKYIINGIAVLVSADEYAKISNLTSIRKAEMSQSFDRPELLQGEVATPTPNIAQNNSSLFIGTKFAADKNIRGQGMRIGIIDTGIDYTHSMLGGNGSEDEFKAIDPAVKSALFPNAKVVGGYDFVGSNFGSSNPDGSGRIPTPDENPIDEAGHGSHVAGTVAGVGDGIKSYDGIAPEAKLYALKVFGKDGGTSDEIVIAALEYAADPNGDGNIDDRLDVVNLSLGSSFGGPRDMYRLAIKNLTQGGTVVVAAAGNAGDTPYVVGAPGVSDEALSVAASVDGMDHNWKFKAIEFHTDQGSVTSEFVEGDISKKLADITTETKDKLVYIGLANKPLTPEQASALKGNAALIDRGGNPFIEKIKLAEAAGAVGVVMVNNADGTPIVMGGEGKVGIPSVMVTKLVGEGIKKEVAKGGDVFVQLKSSKVIEKANLIDTLAEFSSRGPRSEDSLIKPEIAAPGQQIISALMGKGKETVAMSGTSMSGPHMTGVMALLKQFYPELSVTELKSVAMGTAVSIHDESKKDYPVSRMGAGRVQVDKALGALVASEPAALSLGEVRIEDKKVLYREVNIRNLHADPVSYKVRFKGHPAITINEADVSMGPKMAGTLGLKITVDASKIKESIAEVDGVVQFVQGDVEVFRIPVLAIVRKISDLSAESLKVFSASAADSDGAMVELALKNNSSQDGLVVPLNLIALDDRKLTSPDDEGTTSRACDVQAVGYKIVKGKIYFGFKLYEPLTTWQSCELSVLFDTDDDGKADQELAGVTSGSLPGLPIPNQFVSLLLNANVAHALRVQYEASIAMKKPIPLTYVSAVDDVQPMMPLNNSTVALVVADIAKIHPLKTGMVSFKVASTSGERYNVEEDDYLDTDEKQWRKLDLTELGQSYMFNDLAVPVAAKSAKTVTFTKGHGAAGLMLLMPSNRSLSNSVTLDGQMDVVKPTYAQ